MTNTPTRHLFTVDHTSGMWENETVVNDVSHYDAARLELMTVIGVKFYDCESDARIEAGRYGKPVVTR